MPVNVDQRRRQLETELMNLQRQVDLMDAKIRAYLADRENKPHPRHQELVEKIQTYRIDPSITNRKLETMLDNLQWKVYYHNRSWRQLWENAEALRRKNARQKSEAQASGKTSDAEDPSRPIYSVDRLWTIQSEKLEKLGERGASESKDEFVKRIKKRYGQLASEKKDTDEIVMVFNKEQQRCTLELKQKKDAL